MNQRTILITAGSLAAVVLAGVIAVAAILGILGAGADDNVGVLSASVPGTVSRNEDTGVSATESDAPVPGAGPVIYEVPGAGSVEVGREGNTLAVGAITTEPGWTATADPATGSTVVVDMYDDTEGQRLTVSVAGDSVVPVVTDLPVVNANAAPSTRAYDDDDDDHYEDDDDEYDDHDEDDEDHEYDDDDDDHEYDDDDHEYDYDDDDDEYEGGDWDD